VGPWIIGSLGLAGAAAAVALVTGAPMKTAQADQGMAAQASAFESYMRRARAVDPRFSSAGDVAKALQTAAVHDPKQLEAGMIAYAAMAALQEPAFVEALKAQASSGLAARLAEHPEAALSLPGADAAAARASGALYAQGDGLSTIGTKVKGASYTVQREAWSKARVRDAADRLSRIKQLSAGGYQPSREDSAQLRAALSEADRRNGAASPAVVRAVAVAALSTLGAEAQGRSLMNDPGSSVCLSFAKLNLYQCLATSGAQYEDIFCLGQHAMIDPGQCVVRATQANGAIRQAAVR
jgi:hypothetical protein